MYQNQPFFTNMNPPSLEAQRQYFPGGVLFTFPPTIAPIYPMEHISPPLLPLPVNSYFPSSMEYNPPAPIPRQPFKLKLHFDRSTSSSDLGQCRTYCQNSLHPLMDTLRRLQRQEEMQKRRCLPCLKEDPQEQRSESGKEMNLLRRDSGHVVDVLMDKDKSLQVDTPCKCKDKKSTKSEQTQKPPKNPKKVSFWNKLRRKSPSSGSSDSEKETKIKKRKEEVSSDEEYFESSSDQEWSDNDACDCEDMS